jgi:hypothetical protein
MLPVPNLTNTGTKYFSLVEKKKKELNYCGYVPPLL